MLIIFETSSSKPLENSRRTVIRSVTPSAAADGNHVNHQFGFFDQLGERDLVEEADSGRTEAGQ
jgi:hypothetical protein